MSSLKWSMTQSNHDLFCDKLVECGCSLSGGSTPPPPVTPESEESDPDDIEETEDSDDVDLDN